ncbi:MAG TPA: hypothetical protein VLN61_09860 [Pseudolabrys sp.]|nr:hypothetical protein [Pseudolabrys sp.]
MAHSATRDIVLIAGFSPGTIVVKTHERRLYYIMSSKAAARCASRSASTVPA